MNHSYPLDGMTRMPMPSTLTTYRRMLLQGTLLCRAAFQALYILILSAIVGDALYYFLPVYLVVLLSPVCTVLLWLYQPTNVCLHSLRSRHRNSCSHSSADIRYAPACDASGQPIKPCLLVGEKIWREQPKFVCFDKLIAECIRFDDDEAVSALFDREVEEFRRGSKRVTFGPTEQFLPVTVQIRLYDRQEPATAIVSDDHLFLPKPSIFRPRESVVEEEEESREITRPRTTLEPVIEDDESEEEESDEDDGDEAEEDEVPVKITRPRTQLEPVIEEDESEEDDEEEVPAEGAKAVECDTESESDSECDSASDSSHATEQPTAPTPQPLPLPSPSLASEQLLQSLTSKTARPSSSSSLRQTMDIHAFLKTNPTTEEAFALLESAGRDRRSARQKREDEFQAMLARSRAAAVERGGESGTVETQVDVSAELPSDGETSPSAMASSEATPTDVDLPLLHAAPSEAVSELASASTTSNEEVYDSADDMSIDPYPLPDTVPLPSPPLANEITFAPLSYGEVLQQLGVAGSRRGEGAMRTLPERDNISSDNVALHVEVAAPVEVALPTEVDLPVEVAAHSSSVDATSPSASSHDSSPMKATEADLPHLHIAVPGEVTDSASPTSNDATAKPARPSHQSLSLPSDSLPARRTIKQAQTPSYYPPESMVTMEMIKQKRPAEEILAYLEAQCGGAGRDRRPAYQRREDEARAMLQRRAEESISNASDVAPQVDVSADVPSDDAVSPSPLSSPEACPIKPIDADLTLPRVAAPGTDEAIGIDVLPASVEEDYDWADEMSIDVDPVPNKRPLPRHPLAYEITYEALSYQEERVLHYESKPRSVAPQPEVVVDLGTPADRSMSTSPVSSPESSPKTPTNVELPLPDISSLDPDETIDNVVFGTPVRKGGDCDWADGMSPRGWVPIHRIAADMPAADNIQSTPINSVDSPARYDHEASPDPLQVEEDENELEKEMSMEGWHLLPRAAGNTTPSSSAPLRDTPSPSIRTPLLSVVGERRSKRLSSTAPYPTSKPVESEGASKSAKRARSKSASPPPASTRAERAARRATHGGTARSE